MNFAAWLTLYCVLIVAASLAGGWVPMVVRLTHRRMQMATSIIAGFMLGVALLLLLPHALDAIRPMAAVQWLLAGLLTMFFLERFFSYHHHAAPGEEGLPPVTADPEPVADCDQAPGPAIDHAHGHPAGETPHDHAHHDHHHHHGGPHRLSWTGVTVGMVVHSLLDGAALTAAIQAQTHLDAHAWLPGVAVFLVIVLHRPFDSMTLLTLMTGTAWSKTTRHLVNAAFALAVPLGAVLFTFGLQTTDAANAAVIGAALAFSAGLFLCIALADLLPEVQFHQHDKFKLSAAVLLGLALAWAVAHFEHASHAHDDGHDHGLHQHDGHEH